jgi:hypothetical protein
MSDPIAPLADNDLLRAPMEICWQFAYATDNEKLKSLYSKAKKFQWDADTDLDFTVDVDPSKPLVDEAATGGMYFLPIIAKLSPSQQALLRAHLAAYRLSQFLHGEQGALMTAAALTHAVPDHQGKLYAATQTMDEARHVEVFARYIAKVAVIYPMNLPFKAMIDKTLVADHWVKIAIGMNMMVEGMALASFHNMARRTSCALLRQLLTYVLRDESRHVAFGGLYVAEAIAAMHADDREDIADFTFDVLQLLRASRRDDVTPDPGFLSVLDAAGLDRDDFLRDVRTARASGQAVELPRDLVHPFKHLMMPALVRVGAITERARRRYAEVGIPVWEDKAALEAFERNGELS